MIRKSIVYATAIAIGLSAVTPVPGLAQTMASRSDASASVDPLVVATVNAFPYGGEALTDRIRTLVLQNNDLAADVARYLRSRAVLSAAQRTAVEKGLADALNRLGIRAQAGADSNGWLALLALLAIGGGTAALLSNHHNGPVFVSPN